MRLQWHLGTLAKTESKKKKRVNENHFDNHREQKRKKNLKEKKRKKYMSINCQTRQENKVQGDRFYPLYYEKYVPKGTKIVMCKDIYDSP